MKRRLVGAARSAAIFAASLASLQLVWLLLTVEWHVSLEDFVFIAAWAVSAFALVFLLLGLARFTGLVALLVLISALWLWQVLVAHAGEVQPVDFLIWSVFAAPLAMMVSRSRQRVPPSPGARPLSRWTAWALMACWAAVAFVGAELEHRPSWLPVVTWNALEALWIALPPLLTIRALLRLRCESPVESTLSNSLMIAIAKVE